MKCENCRTKEGTLCKDCALCKHCKGDNAHYVVSEPLAYISSYMKTCTAMMLRMAVLTFYQEDVIHEAKLKLMKSVDNLEFDLKDSKENRQNTASRTAREKEFEDIMSIMRMIDESEDTEIRFFAEDLTKIPPAAPESAGSMLSIVEAMSNQNARIDKLQDSILKMMTEIEENKKTIRKFENKPQPTAIPSTSRRASDAAANDNGRNSRSIYANVLKASLSAIEPQGDTSEVDSEANSDVDGYTEVINRSAKKKRLQISKNNERSKDKPKKGTAGLSNLLCSGPESVFIQLTNVKPTVKIEDIKRYIEEKSEGNLKEVSIKDTSSEGWPTKRILVEFKADDAEKVTGNDFWPGTIYFKRWYPAKPKRDASQQWT